MAKQIAAEPLAESATASASACVSANGGGRARVHARLIEAAIAVNGAQDGQAALALLAEAALGLLEATRVSVVVWDESLTRGEIRAVAGEGSDRVGSEVRANDNGLSRAPRTGRPVVSPLGSWISVPLEQPLLTVQAGWHGTQTPASLEQAAELLETLGALTRVAYRDELERAHGRDQARPGEDIGTVSLLRDVTEEHAKESLTARFLERLFDALPTAIGAFDPRTGRLLSVNRTFCELIGYEADEIVGLEPPFPWWASVPGELKKMEWEQDEQTRRLEALLRRKTGELVPVEIVRLMIRDSFGVPVAEVRLGTDLSERRRFEQQLLQSGKLATIGELAAGVAHEVNNPLFAILGLVEFLLKEAEPGTKAYDRLTLIQQTGLEIKGIVRALLDFARERSDEHAVVSLAEVVSQTAELVRRISSAKGVEIVERYPDKLPQVSASASQLKQIFINLLTNAQQAMPDGGTVTIEVRPEGEWVVATVADTGPGIEPDVLPRIFEPFFTTKRVSGGTGLGLPVSFGIAQMHGGELLAESEPGRGATFVLRLPAYRESEA